MFGNKRANIEKQQLNAIGFDTDGGDYIIKALTANLINMLTFFIANTDNASVPQKAFDSSIITLSVAVAEAKAYCKNKKALHLTSFCELFKYNVEDWIQTYDSVQACFNS